MLIPLPVLRCLFFWIFLQIPVLLSFLDMCIICVLHSAICQIELVMWKKLTVSGKLNVIGEIEVHLKFPWIERADLIRLLPPTLSKMMLSKEKIICRIEAWGTVQEKKKHEGSYLQLSGKDSALISQTNAFRWCSHYWTAVWAIGAHANCAFSCWALGVRPFPANKRKIIQVKWKS